MHLHVNARLAPAARRLLVARVREQHWKVADAARAAGVSERTAYKWLARFREEGAAGLADRSSRPARSPRRVAPERVACVLALRRIWMTAAEIAETLTMPLSTVSLVLQRNGLGRRSALVPKHQQRRYEYAQPGELVHVDVKKLARIADGAGHRVHGQRSQQRRRRAGTRVGYEYVHVCIDDATRLAYVEVLDDERATTAVGFLLRALRFYRAHGIRVQRVMTDNGAAYTSRRHARLVELLNVRHLRTRPRRPQTNGKAERFIRTLTDGWAYGAIHSTSDQRRRALPGWLEFSNHRRPHGSLNRQTPAQRMNNLRGSYT